MKAKNLIKILKEFEEFDVTIDIESVSFDVWGVLVFSDGQRKHIIPMNPLNSSLSINIE